jgi:hypothetical protein
VAVVVALTLAVPAGVVAWFFAPPPKHQVRTLIEIPPPGSAFFVRPAEAVPDLQSYQRNQVVLCKSRLVLASALRDPKVANLAILANRLDPIAWLEKEVQADFALSPEIMRISMSGLETDDLVVLVNAIHRRPDPHTPA